MRLLYSLILAIFLAASIAPREGIAANQTVATNASEQAAHDTIFNRAYSLIGARDFAGLNAMEKEFRTTRSRTPSGTWNLAAFYAGVEWKLKQSHLTERCAPYSPDFIKAWIEADPGQPAAHIVDGQLLLDRAWCFRGRGFADHVEESDWVPFRDNADAAYHALADHKTVAVIDPEYYAVMENVYRAQNKSADKFGKLLNEAVSKEPYYYSLYFNAYYYFQPQWHGSAAEENVLAHFGMDRTRNEDGAGLYARFYWSAFQNCGQCALNEHGMDWDVMKTAMDDVVKRYPHDWNFANFAKIACRMADGPTAAKYLSALSAEDKGQPWDDETEWRACQMFAGLYGSDGLPVRGR